MKIVSTTLPSNGKETPLVSVVLPTYNGERWLAESIDSILAQTMQDWELIIVNDCSTDNSPQIAEDYARKDSRIRVIHNEHNKKLPASLNVGFAVARGQLLTWTSDDNLYKPHALAAMSGHLQAHPQTDCVVMNQDHINEEGELLNEYGQRIYTNERENVNMLFGCKRCAEILASYNNFGAAFMYRKSIADIEGKYDEERFCVEDYDFFLRIALAGKIDYLPENVYVYRFNSQSLTSTHGNIIGQRMMLVSQKYLPGMLKKYHYSLHDRLYLFADTQRKTIRECYPILRHLLRWQRSLRKLLYSLAPCRAWRAALQQRMETDLFPHDTRWRVREK